MIRHGDANAVTTSIDAEPTVLYGMKPAAEPARYAPATVAPDATVLVTQQVLPAEGRPEKNASVLFKINVTCQNAQT